MGYIITENSIYESIDKEKNDIRLERVLWIDELENVIVTILLYPQEGMAEVKNLEDFKLMIENGELKKNNTDPFSYLVNPDSNHLEKHRTYRDSAWSIIKELVEDESAIYDPSVRWKLISDVAQKNNVQPKTVLKYVKKYWIAGKMINSLLPSFNKCGAAGQERKANDIKRGRPSKDSKLDPSQTGINIDKFHIEKIHLGIKLYYNSKSKHPLAEAHQLTIENLYHLGFKEKNGVKVPILPPAHQVPTLGQFKYQFYKGNYLTKSIIARDGAKRYALKHRPVLGSAYKMAFGPGSVYQIDATLADVYLVHSYDRSRIIGRPVLYICQDLYSRMVVGMYIGLEGPSWAAMKMALANTTIDKIQFCKQYGIEDICAEEWPCHHLPVSILGDRGELEGKNADELAGSLGIIVSNTPPYRADWKGMVEQTFRLLNLKTIKWLPGSIKERFRERGEPDHRLDSVLDINEFTRLMIWTIHDYNLNHLIKDYPRDEHMIQNNVKPVPIELWYWGIQNKGYLRESTPEAIQLALMPRAKAVVTHEGIRVNGMYYSTEKAIHEEWFQLARARGRWEETAAFDNRNVDTIYLLLNDGKEVVPCSLLEQESRYTNKRLEDVLELLELEDEQKRRHQGETMQTKADLRAKMNDEIEKARQKTDEAVNLSGCTKNQRLKDIHINRADMKEKIREKEKWQVDNSQPSEAAIQNPESEEEFTAFEPRKMKYLNIIKNA